jgi:Zn-dependent peptidase ImmA (M78 family)
MDNLTALLALANDTWSEEEILARTGLDRSLGAARRGDFTGWTTTHVERLARACGIDPAAVWSADALTTPKVAWLRKSWADISIADLVVLRRASAVASAVAALRTEPALATYTAAAPRHSRQNPVHDQAYKLAIRVRTDLGDPTGPIVDLPELAWQLGVVVLRGPFSSPRVDGATLVEGGAVVAIVSSSLRSGVLVRRTIAHELCHALFDPRGPDGHLLRPEVDAEDDDRAEQRARAFAAELLCPKAGIEGLLGRRQTAVVETARSWTVRVAEHFGAPADLTANHLVNREFVAPALREHLTGDVVVREWPHPGSDPVTHTVDRAVDEGRISEGRAAELRTWASRGQRR